MLQGVTGFAGFDSLSGYANEMPEISGIIKGVMYLVRSAILKV
jgi:hypothetical protein